MKAARRGAALVASIGVLGAWVVTCAILAWQAAALMLFVTIGPGAPWLPPPSPLQMSVFHVGLLCLAASSAGAVVLRKRRGRMDSALVLQIGLGLYGVAVSYRFTGLLLLLALVAYRLTRPSAGPVAWGLLVALLVASLAPVDWSLRPNATAGPGLVRADDCIAEWQWERQQASAIVCVSGQTELYSSPRYVWTW